MFYAKLLVAISIAFSAQRPIGDIAADIERVFGGALKPMLVHFIERRRLSRAELDELRALLENPPRGDGSPSKKKVPKS